jgi:plastocyanin domain-containing protein
MQRKGKYETICDCFGLIIYCDVYTWFLLRKNLSGVKERDETKNEIRYCYNIVG